MYTQFFGNFLLNKGILTAEELVHIMEKQASVHLKLGTLAIHEGLLTAPEVDNIVIKQTHQDKKFGEIAVEEGYLSQEEVDRLLSSQKPDYLLLGQILIEDGKLTNADFENLISDYQSLTEIYDLDSYEEQKFLVDKLLSNLCEFEDETNSRIAVDYLTLLFNNLVRFIGNDFTPLEPVPCNEGYPANYCVAQRISGKVSLQTAIDLDDSAAVVFASRYVGENFPSFDEYAKASVEDFLNLHNGLFNVNMSNNYSTELILCPPEVHSGDILDFSTPTYTFPIIFPFGMIHFVMAF